MAALTPEQRLNEYDAWIRQLGAGDVLSRKAASSTPAPTLVEEALASQSPAPKRKAPPRKRAAPAYGTPQTAKRSSKLVAPPPKTQEEPPGDSVDEPFAKLTDMPGPDTSLNFEARGPSTPKGEGGPGRVNSANALLLAGGSKRLRGHGAAPSPPPTPVAAKRVMSEGEPAPEPSPATSLSKPVLNPSPLPSTPVGTSTPPGTAPSRKTTPRSLSAFLFRRRAAHAETVAEVSPPAQGGPSTRSPPSPKLSTREAIGVGESTGHTTHEVSLATQLLAEKYHLQIENDTLQQKLVTALEEKEKEAEVRERYERMVADLQVDVRVLAEEKVALVRQLNKLLGRERSQLREYEASQANEEQLEARLKVLNETNEELLGQMNAQLKELGILANLNRDLVEKVDTMKELEYEKEKLTLQVALFMDLSNENERRCQDLAQQLKDMEPVAEEKDALLLQLNQLLISHDRELKACSDNYATFTGLGDRRTTASVEYLKQGEAVFHAIRTPEEKVTLLKETARSCSPDAVLRVVLFLRETLRDDLFFEAITSIEDEGIVEGYLKYLREQGDAQEVFKALRALGMVFEEAMERLAEALREKDLGMRKRSLEWCLSFCLEHHHAFSTFHIETIKTHMKRCIAEVDGRLGELASAALDVEAYLGDDAAGVEERATVTMHDLVLLPPMEK